MEKIDALKLSADGRAILRKMVLRLRKQLKMPMKELAAIAEVHVRSVKAWLGRARREGKGSLEVEKKRGRPVVGACRKLTMKDEIRKTPGELKLPFALWTRVAVMALIKERFDIEMQDRSFRKYLKRWGFTPQRSIKRALEQDPKAVKTWPKVLARAHAEGAAVLWGDETAVRVNLSMISAISARGQVSFKIVDGTINTERFIEFLELLLKDARQKILLVVDNLRVHHAKKVTAWLSDKKDRIELIFLPPYATESNPDEYLNRDFKTALCTGPVSHDKTSLLAKAKAFMNKLAAMPERVISFRHPTAAYAVHPPAPPRCS